MKNINYIIFLLLLISCSDKSNELIEISHAKYFNDKNFKEIKKVNHEIFNDNFIGYPVRVISIDTFLIAVDMKKDSIFHIFSTKSKKYLGNFIPRGSGPNELITCSNITQSNIPRTFWAFDISSRKFSEYNIDSLFNNKQELKSTINFNKIKSKLIGINQPQWISDSTVICNSLFKYNERFFIFDKELNLKKKIYNNNLNIYDKFPDNILGDIFSSFINVKPDKSKIAIAGRYLDLLEIYDSNGNLLAMTKGPNKDFNFKFDIESSLNQGTMIKLPETRRGYIGIKTTNNCIYLLYSGKERRNPNHYSFSNTIYTFDWNGNPLNKYELDAQISSFAIDEKENKIYALHHDAYIITYNM